MEHFNIIQALCRSALSATPSSALIHQVERLRDALLKDGHEREAKSLSGLLTNASKTFDMAPSKIQRSKAIGGEELTPNSPIPVDKETSTPLAEIIFPADFPTESPVFDNNVDSAIQSVLAEWTNFDKLVEIQAQPSRSCLIYGAPGTGKTYLAMWIAKQINIPVVLARLDGLMSSFLGTTSRNIGNLFAFAGRYRCILLLDEFDAIAKLRNDPQEVGEIKRVVNTLLQNLDNRKDIGFTIGITNHETLLDPAIWRRFEVQVEIPKPSPKEIKKIIQRFVVPLNFDDNELNFLAWSIENSSGSDAEGLAKWLKKMSVIQPDQTLVNIVKKFAILNSGRIDSRRRNILTNEDNEDLTTALLSDSNYSFKLKDIASILGKSSSTLSRQLSKFK